MEQLETFSPLYVENKRSDLPFDMQNLHWVNEELGYNIDRYRSNNRYTIIWIVDGFGNYYQGFNEQIIGNDHLLFIRPGELPNLKLPKRLKGYIISFTSGFFDFNDHDHINTRIHQLFHQTHYMEFNNDTIDEFQDIMDIVMKEFNKYNLYRPEILRRYFTIFLIYLSGQAQPQITARYSRNEEIFQNFSSIVNKNFRTQKMVSDYADQLFVTPNYLNQLVKKLTGYSAGYHIRQRIAAEAKLQATQPNNCMKAIAYNLGFADMAHFSKFFKNTTGINFSDFKKNSPIPQPI